MILVERAARIAAEAEASGAKADPQAWLADVLARIANHPVQRLDELPPWRWRRPPSDDLAQAA